MLFRSKQSEQPYVTQPIAFPWQQGGTLGMSGTLVKNQTMAVAYVGGVDYENNGHTMDEPTGPLMKGSPTGGGRPLPAVAFTQDSQFGGANKGEVSPTLSKSGLSGTMGGAGAEVLSVFSNMQVRRLTPVECERLQGFPDGYTDIKPKGKPTPDGPRYKALGNSMAVPVMRWIGERIKQVEEIS